MDAFMQIFDDKPIAKVLEILEISSPSFYDLSNKCVLKHFRARLKRCRQPRELTLKLNISHGDTGHAAFFFPSLSGFADQPRVDSECMEILVIGSI